MYKRLFSSAMELLSRRTLAQYGAVQNEGASTDFSDFAKKMMKKWGHEEFRCRCCSLFFFLERNKEYVIFFIHIV